jgi:hypothetical protein
VSSDQHQQSEPGDVGKPKSTKGHSWAERLKLTSREKTVFTVSSVILGALSGTAGLVSFYVHGSTAVLLSSVGLLAVASAFVAVNRGAGHSVGVPVLGALAALIGAVVVAGAIGGVVAYNIWPSARSSVSATSRRASVSPSVAVASSTAAVPHRSASPTSSVRVPPKTTGAFTYPVDGAENVPSKETLQAAGIAQNIQPQHHLLIFLQWVGLNTYWGGDPDVLVKNGQWTGTVCVGDPGSIKLYLVDLGPEGLKALNSNDWNNGFPFPPTKLAPDVSILAEINIHSVFSQKNSCVKNEPAYYS